MTITLNLSPETERCLRAKATQSGQSVEDYLGQLVVRDIWATNGSSGANPGEQLSPAELNQRLDELSEGLPSIPTLPADWSRADVYTEHD